MAQHSRISKADHFERIVDGIYGAAIGAAQWSDVVEDLRQAMNASSGLLFEPLLPPNRGGLWELRGIDPDSIADYVAYYQQHDVWNRGFEALGGAHGAVFDGDMLVEREAFERSEFYNDFLRQYGIYSLCASVLNGNGRSYAPTRLSLYRAPGAEHFNPVELRFVQRIMPHIDRALEIRSRLDGSRALDRDCHAALDRLTSAVMLIDRRGRVVFANATAERLLALGDGLVCRNGMLSASHDSEHRDLCRLIARATAPQIAADADGALAVSRPSGSPPWSVLVSPLPIERVSVCARQQPVAILFAVDPSRPNRTSADLLIQLFDFTSAEARLAAALAAGGRLAAVARQQGISLNTARWHLKHVFQKLGVAHQTELVSLVSSLPDFVRPGSQET